MSINSKPICKVEIDLDLTKAYLQSKKEKGMALGKELFMEHAIEELRPFIENTSDLTDEKDVEFAKKLNTAKDCTIVYHACGTCNPFPRSGEGALREYFCDGGGSGSGPDHTRCDLC